MTEGTERELGLAVLAVLIVVLVTMFIVMAHQADRAAEQAERYCNALGGIQDRATCLVVEDCGPHCATYRDLAPKEQR